MGSAGPPHSVSFFFFLAFFLSSLFFRLFAFCLSSPPLLFFPFSRLVRIFSHSHSLFYSLPCAQFSPVQNTIASEDRSQGSSKLSRKRKLSLLPAFSARAQPRALLPFSRKRS